MTQPVQQSVIQVSVKWIKYMIRNANHAALNSHFFGLPDCYSPNNSDLKALI